VTPRVFFLPLPEETLVLGKLVLRRSQKLFHGGIGMRPLLAAPLKLLIGPLHASERTRVIAGAHESRRLVERLLELSFDRIAHDASM
jgi:hypothetical protein